MYLSNNIPFVVIATVFFFLTFSKNFILSSIGNNGSPYSVNLKYSKSESAHLSNNLKYNFL